MIEQTPDRDDRTVGGETGEALLVFDSASRLLLHADPFARALFHLRDHDVPRAEELIPQLADLAPRRFHAQGKGTAREMSVRVEPLGSGPLAHGSAVLVILRTLAQPLAGNGSAPPLVGVPRSVRAERLESLWSLVVRRGLAGAEQVKAILREGMRGFGLSAATLSRLDGKELVVEFVAEPADAPSGTRIPLDRSLAKAALRRSGTFSVLDTADDPEFADMATPARCFVSAAFRVGDQQWAVTFSSQSPRVEPFDSDDWNYVDTLCEALARSVERREADARIERLAFSDALTTLPNRVAVLARLDEAIAEAERSGGRVAVLFLDIDGFKTVNDTVGHRAGDDVLAEVAQRLRGTIRREEFIGRLGGDEFAIVMPHLGERTEIESIAQRIGGVLTFPFSVDTYRFSLSASIGVAIYPDDATAREELIDCADAAMYSAKDQGGSRIRFRTQPSEGVPSEISDEPRDIGYLLTYQPILDLRTGEVSEAEALIRRLHPLHGLLAPERGWSIARDEPGRRALDRWVLREAVSQARAWHRAGASLRIDINLAAFDPEEIEALAADPVLGKDVHHLRVEVSPQQFGNSGALDAFIEACMRHGIRFALDGFDGQLSTLATLAHLPIDAVKLDRSLVESVLASRTARAIVEGTVVIAKSLGWRVVAKGVETAAQHEALIALGCDAVQGFHIAHPMSAVDFGTWLRDRVAPDA